MLNEAIVKLFTYDKEYHFKANIYLEIMVLFIKITSQFC